jgi:hypothetical protein
MDVCVAALGQTFQLASLFAPRGLDKLDAQTRLQLLADKRKPATKRGAGK